MLLQETSRIVAVTGTVKKNNFIYNVDYRMRDKQLERLYCDIVQVGKAPIDTPEGPQDIETTTSIGYISNEGGQTQYSLREDADVVPHAEMFSKILTEVKKAIK